MSFEMLRNTEGLSSSGIERKATCKALFSKMLYLADYEPLLNQESEVKETVNLREVSIDFVSTQMTVYTMIQWTWCFCFEFPITWKFWRNEKLILTSNRESICWQIFGATESDVEKLRIISLQDIDMDKLDDMVCPHVPIRVRVSPCP